MNATEYHIQQDTHGETGLHWDTLRPIDEYLSEHLEDMGAALRLLNEEASYGDLIRLEIEVPEGEVAGAGDIVDTWYLDVATASWNIGTLNDAQGHRPLCRVELVTGTGGPHAELIGIYNRAGECVRVEAHQYWSGHREAWTTDPRALEVFEAFSEAFVYVEG